MLFSKESMKVRKVSNPAILMMCHAVNTCVPHEIRDTNR